MLESIRYADLDGDARALDPHELDTLRADHRGPCLTEHDAGFDAARVIWNAATDATPAIVARATGVADVVAAVRFARRHRMLTAIRGGGHNVAGHALADRGLVIDLSGMRGVRVDAAKRRAWVDGGALLGDVDRETQLYGLAAPLGVVSQTGVAGLTLCGGYGWLRRRFGAASDSVRTFEVVTADARVVRASADEHEDLFWALRGGGGNFGVVTGFEFDLHSVGPEVVMLGIAYPIERAREVLVAWRDFMAESPPELASNLNFWTLPAMDPIPADLQGREVCLIGGCWTGKTEEGLAHLQPLRAMCEPLLDLTGPTTWCDSQRALDGFFEAGARRNYWKSIYVDRLDDEVIAHIVSHGSNRPDPWSLVALWHLEGTVQPPNGSSSHGGNRGAPWLLSLDTGWEDPAKDNACIEWTRALWDETRRFSSSGGCYLNFPGDADGRERLLRASYGHETFERLQRVKATWDPNNLFRRNQNIPPKRS